MKKTLLLLILFFSSYIRAQNVNIPDANFKNALLDHGVTITGEGVSKIDINDDGEIQVTEATAYAGTINVVAKNISDLSGIEAFINVTELWCSQNQLTALNLTQNTALVKLSCFLNQLATLNLSQNTQLEFLGCSHNQLTNLDLSQNTVLNDLSCFSNQLTSLNITNNTLLTSLNCALNALTTLNINQNVNLTHLSCSDNQITNLDITANTVLEYLICSSNQLTSLDCSNNPLLKGIYCERNHLNSLNISQNTALETFWCYSNSLTSLDVSQNTVLKNFWCYSNNLFNLNLANGNNNLLIYLNATDNPNLSCIQIDNGFTIPSSDWEKDATASYNTYCALSTDDFEFSKQFTVYPNPVKDVLNIQNNEGITVKKYTILDVNGRILINQSKEIQNNSINFSSLSNGTYFIQIETEKGLVTKKIIKE
ncbi:T9SS type A sorting domain-containing protein [Flavobacterium sp. TP390]|uniref:T9SS type A sorting domain-containing protein n=1 Tax=Flavobacterium profundi TaxID=1774945 RepID=A0A6I4IKJ7_9FLAO|nr:T9SS type A sorting domain-containing protein [Flavobacterium profundi]MVO08879.1 T9SS type A sorting domain-containing protein [Flavobacterium profundi]